MRNAIGCLGLIVIGFFGLMVFGQYSKERGVQERASAIQTNPWRTEVDVGIARALVQGGAKGCADYRYKSVDGDSEYIVECYDGPMVEGEYTRIRYYRVWPKIESAVGPYETMPTN